VNLLGTIPGVVKTHLGASPGTVVAEVTGQDDLVELLAQEVVKSGSGLLEMQSMAQLEDVFIKLTYGSIEQ
jgi:hypothetical protein